MEIQVPVQNAYSLGVQGARWKLGSLQVSVGLWNIGPEYKSQALNPKLTSSQAKNLKCKLPETPPPAPPQTSRETSFKYLPSVGTWCPGMQSERFRVYNL